MKKTAINKITLSAIFSALIILSTAVLSIRLPNGYANLGDCFVIVGALVLGKYYGSLSAAVGAGIADIILGFMIYFPATVIIKILMAIIASSAYKIIKTKYAILKTALIAILCEIVMILGYFIYEIFLYGIKVAELNIIGNTLQGAVGCIGATVIFAVLKKSKVLKKLK